MYVVMGYDQIEIESCDRMFKGNKEAKKLGYLDADVGVALKAKETTHRLSLSD